MKYHISEPVGWAQFGYAHRPVQAFRFQVYLTFVKFEQQSRRDEYHDLPK
jgi:hypothetical protein